MYCSKRCGEVTRQIRWRLAHPGVAANRAKAWQELNPERYRKTALDGHLRRSYSLSLSEYEAMVLAQGGKCAICGGEELGHYGRLLVDHDHESKKVRALLCNECNLMVGHSEDSPDLLRAAAEYLEKWAVRRAP